MADYDAQGKRISPRQGQDDVYRAERAELKQLREQKAAYEAHQRQIKKQKAQAERLRNQPQPQQQPQMTPQQLQMYLQALGYGNQPQPQPQPQPQYQERIPQTVPPRRPMDPDTRFDEQMRDWQNRQ